MQIVYDILNVGVLRERTGNAIDYFWFIFLINPNFVLLSFAAQLSRVGTVSITDLTLIESAWDWTVVKWTVQNIGVAVVQLLLILLFEYAHITTLFKTKLDIKNLDQEVLKQDAVYLDADQNENENGKVKDADGGIDAKMVDINQNVLTVVEDDQPLNNYAIVATDILK